MSDSPRYPRVLVVGQPFDRRTGGGITLCNLFEGWPLDRLACVTPSDEALAFDVCDRYYLLGSDEIEWAWPLSRVSRRETPASRADLPRRAAASDIAVAGARSRSALNRVFRAAVVALGVEDVLRSTHMSPGLHDWIADFRPDIVYSQLSDIPVMTLVTEVLDDTGVPFAFHVMDDWPSSMYRSGTLSTIVRHRAQRLFESLLGLSAVRMAIGDAMADEYLRRYGLAFTPLQNSVDVARIDALAAAHRGEFDAPPGSPLRVVYAGRVGRANAESIATVAAVVSGMQTSGRAVEFRIHTASTDHPVVARIAGLAGVEVMPPVPYDRVPALLAAADVLLLPLDFDEESVRFARLSMPTKIPEYMAAGRPVLTYAPRGCAAAEYARTGGWSLLVDEPDPSAVRDALASLASDPALRVSMGAAGRKLVASRHDAAKVRSSFAAELAEAARA